MCALAPILPPRTHFRAQTHATLHRHVPPTQLCPYITPNPAPRPPLHRGMHFLSAVCSLDGNTLRCLFDHLSASQNAFYSTQRLLGLECIISPAHWALPTVCKMFFTLNVRPKSGSCYSLLQTQPLLPTVNICWSRLNHCYRFI